MARRGLAFFVLFVLMLIAGGISVPRVARADQPGAHTVSVAVLSFDSEDSEEQADAITGAIRSRIRAASGWSLIETNQPLAMLTAAMRCPARPTPECQAKIGDQLKAERYIWGVVAKGPTQGQVTAEIHLYQKGKPDSVLKESYADNLKDSNDDTLRKIATRIVERLGATTVGAVVVRAPDQTGEVVIDGEKHVPLDKSGSTRLELAAGGHSIELAPASAAPTKRNVLVTAGAVATVDFGPVVVAEPPPEPSNPGRTRKIIGGIAMGSGVVLGVFAVQQLLLYIDLQDRGPDAARGVTKDKDCATESPECAKLDSKSKTASGLAIGLGAAGAAAIGVGAYLFFTAPSSSSTADAKMPPKRMTRVVRVVPSMGPDSGSLVVLGTF